MISKKPFDFGIFIVILILLVFGILMVFSASSPAALNEKGNSYYYLTRQLAWAVIGLICMLVVSKIDYRFWGKLSGILYFVSIALLLIVLIPHIGVEKNGARRWINLGFTEFQPSEIVKLSIIIFFSYRLAKAKDLLNSFSKGFMPYVLRLGLIGGLLLLQPHMSSAGVIILVGMILLFIAGARIWHFIVLALPALSLGALAIFLSPYRLQRVTSFLNPWNDPKGDGWQIIQSLLAIGSGGLFGVRFGQSRQKFLYIPEPHNDFIFSILAEELGYIGVVTVLILFLIFIWRGIRIAMHAPDTFGSLLAAGITSLVAIQTVINVAVVTSSVPVTGMPLPLFSYGITNLWITMASLGVINNISIKRFYY